jgi:hypothetical protein
LIPVLSWMNPLPTFLPSFFHIHFKIITYLFLGLPSVFFP